MVTGRRKLFGKMARRKKPPPADSREVYRFDRRDGRRVARWNWRHEALREAMELACLSPVWLAENVERLVVDAERLARPIASRRILAIPEERLSQAKLALELEVSRERLRVVEEWILRRLSALARTELRRQGKDRPLAASRPLPARPRSAGQRRRRG